MPAPLTPAPPAPAHTPALVTHTAPPPPPAQPGSPPAARSHGVRGAAAAALCLFALAAALSGCGGGGGGKESPGVASLPGAGTASASASAAGDPSAANVPAGTPTTDATGSATGSATGDSARPQERLDDTPAEREALIHAWDVCLVAHGAHWTTTRSGVAGAPKQVADPVPPAAHAACEDKLPLTPPELDPNLNPRYRDDMLAEVACLRSHGVMVHLTQDTSVDPNGLGWTFDSSTTKVPDDEGQIENACQLAAFGNGKGK